MGGCGKTLSSAPPSPQTLSGCSSSLTSFPNCPWCHRGAGSTVPCSAQHYYYQAWAHHSLSGRLLGLSVQISLLCTRWGAFKVPSLSLQCHRDVISGLKPCLVDVCSSETSPKKWLLMQDNESALEPIVSVSKQQVLKHRQGLCTLTK